VRDIYSDWKSSGKPSVEQRAAAEVERIMETHQPMPLPDDAQKEIDAIYRSAERDAASK
jgi:trimethylamine:corrinoid methyltransferase-like protein